MAAVEKIDTSLPLEREETAAPKPLVREADGSNATQQASPARELQDRLSSEIILRDDKYSPRVVSTLVIMFCASTWVGGYLLYSMF
ncbi:MAG: hypothetical protein V3V03_06320 [Hyphomonadaceae bacterium]